MLSTTEIMLVRNAVSTSALENDWDAEKEQEMFHAAIGHLIELQTHVSKKKRHKQ
jgi:hypothetical protein